VLGHLCGARHERDVANLLKSLLDRGFIIKHMYADDYTGFRQVIPEQMITQRSYKANTFTIDQSNSDVRHWLARFRRREKVVSKSAELMAHSLTLLTQFQTNHDIKNLINLVAIYSLYSRAMQVKL
jgi:IS1 family transposase